MEQRRYHSTLTPEALGDLLVTYFDQQRRTDAQRLGSGDSVLVQVRRGREDRQRLALTIGITRQVGDGSGGEAPGISHPADEEAPPPNTTTAIPDLVVTLGEQQWFTSSLHGGAIVGSLIGALFTPWALFGLIWPLSHAASDHVLPNDLWATVDNYVLTQGGMLVSTTDIRHPHGTSNG